MSNNDDIRSLLHNARLKGIVSASFFESLWYAYFIDQRVADIEIDYYAKTDGILEIALKKTSVSTVYDALLIVIKENDVIGLYKINLGFNCEVEKIYKAHNIAVSVHNNYFYVHSSSSSYSILFSAVREEIDIPDFQNSKVNRDTLLDYKCKVRLIIQYSDISEQNIQNKTFYSINRNLSFATQSHYTSFRFYNMMFRNCVYKDYLELKITRPNIPDHNVLPKRRNEMLPVAILRPGNLMHKAGFWLYYHHQGSRVQPETITLDFYFYIRNYYNRVVTNYEKSYDFFEFTETQNNFNRIIRVLQFTPNNIEIESESYIKTRISNNRVKNIFRSSGYADIYLNYGGKFLSLETSAYYRKDDQEALGYIFSLEYDNDFYRRLYYYMVGKFSVKTLIFPLYLVFTNNNIEYIKFDFIYGDNLPDKVSSNDTKLEKRNYYHELYPSLGVVTGMAVEQAEILA